MPGGYYSDFDDYTNETIIDNPIGRGIDVDTPVDRLGKEHYITGKKKILQCMKDVLDTPKGNRFMFPLYGSKLYQILEEPNDLILEDIAELYIKEALDEWEPRIIVDEVICRVSPEDNNVLLAQVNFHMKNSNDEESFVYSTNRVAPEMR